MSSKPTKKTPTAPAEGAPKYQMPAVEIGDSVVWSHGIDDPSQQMALVTAVGTETVNLAVLDPDSFNFRPIDGVRHADFPDPARIAVAECGCWRRRPADLTLLGRLADLESAVFPAPEASKV